jgi:hypothetical protein
MTGRVPEAKPTIPPVRTCRWIEGDVRQPGWSYWPDDTIRQFL